MRRRSLTLAENIKRMYLKLCGLVKFISLTLTLFLIPAFLMLIVFYTFVDFSPVRVLLSCLCLWVMIDSNTKL